MIRDLLIGLFIGVSLTTFITAVVIDRIFNDNNAALVDELIEENTAYKKILEKIERENRNV